MKFPIKPLIAAGLLAASPLAAAQQAPVDYVNAQLALGLVEDLDDPFALVLTAGKRLPNVAQNFAVEVEFTDTINAAEERGVSLSYWTLGGYAVMSFPLDDRLSGRVRGGLRMLKAYAGGEDEDDFGLTFGLGVGYRFAANMSFIGEFTYLGEIDQPGDDIGVNHLSAGVQVHF
jgi:hypothetical protein